jgi:hypothetical protein
MDKRKYITFIAVLFACNATAAISDEMNANILLHQYDTLTGDKRLALEQTVLTAEAAMREANSVIVLQRSEYGLYCPPLESAAVAKIFTAEELIELIRHEVDESPFVGKEEFEIALLHALQVKFRCPARPK